MKDDRLTPIWKALSDPTRRRILDLLKERPRTTGELTGAFKNLSRFAVMKHLAVLEAAELVIVSPQGRERWNHLNAIPLRRIYERWLRPYEAEWASKLLQLKQHIEEPRGEKNIFNMPDMSTYLYQIQPTRLGMLTEGPTPAEAEVISQHFDYLKDLTEKGVAVLVGRTLTTNEQSFGIVIFQTDSENEAHAIMNNDPAVKNGVMQATLYPFRIALMAKT